MTLKELTAEIESGAIDTIVVAFTDMQGRLMGKRVHSQFFLEGEVAEFIPQQARPRRLDRVQAAGQGEEERSPGQPPHRPGEHRRAADLAVTSGLRS